VNLHPLQLACATLAIVFTLGLFGATQWLRQQQLNSQQPRLALQLAATPL
jgi:Tfp pilus assembly protein FimT